MPETDKHQNLIQEGLSSYLDAVIAIDEFTRLIQNDCRQILETNAARLEKVSGLTFSIGQITPESEPYNGRGRTWNSQLAWIGAFLPVKTPDKFHSFGMGISWEHENGGASAWCYSEFYTQTRSALDEIATWFDALSPGKFDLDKSQWALGLWRENPLRVQGDYQTNWDKLINEWVDAWKRVGGVKGLFARGHK